MSIWKIALSTLTCIMIVMCIGHTNSHAQPNILVITADDLGSADVGYRGSDIRTPNIDALASAGLVLESFYTHPYCIPSRAALYSGMFPRSEAFNLAKFNVNEGDGIEQEIYTIAERFRDANYATGLIGKWHLGSTPETHPNVNGFDYFYGHLGGGIYYFTHTAIDFSTTPWTNYPDWQRNGVDIDEEGYSTNLIGQDAAAFITNRDPSKPFFLSLNFNAPHWPLNAHVSVIDWYEANTNCSSRANRCIYMAQVDTLDEEIGRVIQTLDSEGITNDTIVLFFTDNGGYVNLGASNDPLKGGKLTGFEGAIRVPAIVKWPGVVNPGTTDQMARIEDIYATLEAAVGLGRKAPCASKNLWWNLVNGFESYREPFYFSTMPEDLTELNASCSNCGRPGVRRAILIDNGWKLITVQAMSATGDGYVPERTEFLYNIANDPFEEQDHVADRPGILQRMRAALGLEEALQEWRDSLAPPVGCEPSNPCSFK